MAGCLGKGAGSGSVFLPCTWENDVQISPYREGLTHLFSWEQGWLIPQRDVWWGTMLALRGDVGVKAWKATKENLTCVQYTVASLIRDHVWHKLQASFQEEASLLCMWLSINIVWLLCLWKFLGFLRNVYLLVDLGKSNHIFWWVVLLGYFKEQTGTLNNGKLFLQTAGFLCLVFSLPRWESLTRGMLWMKGEALQRVLLLRFYSCAGIFPSALDPCDENGVAIFNSCFLI